ncbi:MAG: formimidoylglutamate deiminase [Acidobacteriota bacterium]
MDLRGQTVAAELTWTGDAFVRNVAVRMRPDGRIAEIETARDDRVDHTLPRRALLPGFVNAHSHAFQRGLRGRGETFPAGAGSFWTWREAMYGLVEALDRDELYTVCRRAFEEMRLAGMTTVGEFHYLHHDDADRLDYAFDEVVLDAARDVGIRIVLLQAYYRTGGIGTPLAGGQRRFATPDLDSYWRKLDHLANRVDGELQRVGVVAHSLRAVPVDDLTPLFAGARERGMVVHMHVEEQRQEIAQSLEAYSQRPMHLLDEVLDLDKSFTAVHCTHTNPGDLELMLAAGGHVCICPLTEANLGDGIADLPRIVDAGGGLCLGSDSNARISMIEEMRWLEYVQRLARERRGVVVDRRGSVARKLLHAATAGGGAALGIDCGAIQDGQWADLTVIDLDAPALAGSDDDTLLEAMLFGASDDVIAGTVVGGQTCSRLASTL